jgi:CHASE3 domain sensor protein
MANIDVQRKKKSPLPWILIALLLLAALAYFLWSRNKTHDNGEVTGTDTTITTTTTDTTRR